MFEENKDKDYVESKIMVQIREDVKRLEINQYTQSALETLKEMSLKLKNSYLKELSDILNNVIETIQKENKKIDKMKSVLRKYLDKKSLDGVLERQELRRELQEMLDEQA